MNHTFHVCNPIHALRHCSFQTWPYLTYHLIIVQCGNGTCSQYDSRGSGSTTRLSGYRENTGNRWETDLIMFSFFPISILWKVCSQPFSSFKNHSYNCSSPPLFTQGLCVGLSFSPKRRRSPTKALCDICACPRMSLFVYALNETQLLLDEGSEKDRRCTITFALKPWL